MTGGGVTRTSGGISAFVIVLVVSVVTLIVAVVNAFSRVDEIERANLAIAPWEPWVWELTSAAFWIAIAVPLVAVARRLRPPTMRWPMTLVALVALSIPVCALHLAWFALSRGLFYYAIGLQYTFDGAVLYEWRKDVLSVLAFAGIAYALDSLAAKSRVEPHLAGASPSFRLEVRDGARKHWLAPHDIERIEAAGNYVELFTATGAVLHRNTLANVEVELEGHGFVRVHRSRLVRRDAVVSVVGTPAGDFNATLASGAIVAGSRRYKELLRR